MQRNLRTKYVNRTEKEYPLAEKPLHISPFITDNKRVFQNGDFVLPQFVNHKDSEIEKTRTKYNLK